MSGMNSKASGDMGTAAEVTRNAGVGCAVQASTTYTVECRDSQGNLKWVDTFHNLVVTEGLNKLITDTFKSSNYTSAWYVGLTDGTPTVIAGNTMASHAGWVEVVAYDEATRQALTLGSVAAGAASNVAAKATFTISANGTTIGGAFLCTDGVKSATDGILYGAGAFTAGDKTIDDNDTLAVTVTLTQTAA
jgi:hypothetical protein